MHALQGGSSMRSKGGDPHAAREVIHALRGSGSMRSEGVDPRAPREVFHALPWDVIHALEGRPSMTRFGS